MSTEDLEDYESEVELQLYREYKDVVPMFRYWVETERRSYLANHVEVQTRAEGGRTWVELELRDAWVLDMFRTNRFLPRTKVLSFKDVVVEELPHDEADAAAAALDLDRVVGPTPPPGGGPAGSAGPTAPEAGGSGNDTAGPTSSDAP